MSRIAAAASRAYRAAEYSSSRIGDVDQMVRDAAALGQRHLVGADVESAIDGGRIAADDFPAEPLRERDAERALAGGGRAEDRDERGRVREPRRASRRERAQSERPARARPAAARSPICCVRVGPIIGPADFR